MVDSNKFQLTLKEGLSIHGTCTPFMVLRGEAELLLFCRYPHCYTHTITLRVKHKVRGRCSLGCWSVFENLQRKCISLAGEVFGFSTNLISVSLALKTQWLLTVTRNIKVEAFIPW